jgi:hypothetical protein
MRNPGRGAASSESLFVAKLLVIALKGTKPREFSGSQPDRSLRKNPEVG